MGQRNVNVAVARGQNHVAHVGGAVVAVLVGRPARPGDRIEAHVERADRVGDVLDRKLAAVLYEKDRIAGATRGGADRGGLRFSPHIYNSPAEIDRVLAAVSRYVKSGV